MIPQRDDRALLHLDHATVLRGQTRVLDDLCLRLDDGQHTAILGPNGSGKSSLIRLITRQYYPQLRPEGHPAVRIYGRDRWNVTELRSMLGIVSPDIHGAATDGTMLGLVSGREAVLSGFFASAAIFEHHVVTDAMRARADAVLELVSANHLAEKPVIEMSTGEARRIIIARALVSAPRALLLDEPTAGLDLLAMGRFLETLRRVASAGMTLLLVTHHIDEIIPEVSRVILLKAGRVYRDGPTTEVLTSATLSALYDAPIAVERSQSGYHRAWVGE